MLLISPYARNEFVDHTVYDATSVLKFIEWRYGLQPLAARDAGANNLLAAFDFGDSAGATPQGLPNSGGPNVLLPSALVGSAILTAIGVILWQRLLQQD
jgi:phospholipase C